jgi:hypothetical protein
MRLLHLKRVRKRGDVRAGQPEPQAEAAVPHRVTTQQLKRQFEERLDARTRRRLT